MSPHLFGDFELYDMQLRWVVLLAINQLFKSFRVDADEQINS